jgi:hypothetical protein
MCERVRHSCATVEMGFPAVLSGCPAVETPENGKRRLPLLVRGRVRIPVAVAVCVRPESAGLNSFHGRRPKVDEGIGPREPNDGASG